jgi:hypothetical protein
MVMPMSWEFSRTVVLLESRGVLENGSQVSRGGSQVPIFYLMFVLQKEVVMCLCHCFDILPYFFEKYNDGSHLPSTP